MCLLAPPIPPTTAAAAPPQWWTGWAGPLLADTNSYLSSSIAIVGRILCGTASPTHPAHHCGAPPQWWAGWAGQQPAGAWQHASSPCIHVLHTCAESNKIAGHVPGTRAGGCPKEQIYPIMHGTLPAHPQENTKLASCTG